MLRFNYKHIVLLTALSAGVFACTLFNQFVGDDHVLFEGNTFYASWNHWPDLFTKRYLTPSRASEGPSAGPIYHSGSVAYRPVLSLTYFFDYGLWKLDPRGYHLTNLILHTFNTLLVYALLVEICGNPSMALFSACLFSVHPTKVEAVACIGYRADLLACFLQLLSLLSFIYYRRGQGKRYGAFCLAAYFLALFTKESALVMPLIFLAHDFYFGRFRRPMEYLALSALTGFYLYIYFFIFPNTSLVRMQYFGGTLAHHLMTMAWIFARYMIDLLLPFQVVMMPPLYLPSLGAFWFLKMLTGLVILGALIIGIIKFYKTNKRLSFFLLFFLVGFIPIAGIIPLANPMAHRFLYFPSIAFAAAAGLGLAAWKDQVSRLFKFALVGLCVAYTVPLDLRWNNDVTVARSLLENYPDNSKSHLILAVQMLKAGEKRRAGIELEKCIRLGDKAPWIYDLLRAASPNKN